MSKAQSHHEKLYGSKIIQEDIVKLSKHLKDQIKYFEGKTFLVTGAGGFLGNYIVLLFRYLNKHVLKRKLTAILLDNFITGYEQLIVSDDYLIFKKHNVIEPFKTDQKIDYLVHAAGIASPVYYTKFPVETMDVGTIGTRNMLELAREKKVKSFLLPAQARSMEIPITSMCPPPKSIAGMCL